MEYPRRMTNESPLLLRTLEIPIFIIDTNSGQDSSECQPVGEMDMEMSGYVISGGDKQQTRDLRCVMPVKK